MASNATSEKTIKLLPGSPARVEIKVPRFCIRVNFRLGGSAAYEVLTSLILGRSKNCDVPLDDPAASSKHLKVELCEGGLVITDLGSTNGTKINGVRVEKAIAQVGDKISVGETKMVVELIDEPLVLLPEKKERLGSLVGKSEKMRLLYRILQRIAPTEFTVLIQGETGVGKELVAKTIHELSSRSNGPLVIVDGASLSGDLAADTLFGHERGAYTGADNQRQGAFERANGGTIFLDEIGELPPDVQATLLRVLETRSFDRLGGQSIKVDVRVVAATLRSLKDLVAAGTFRNDLFYRLNELNVNVPPLRERMEDLPLLVKHLVQEHAKKMGNLTDLPLVSQAALEHMKSYTWPGNVRELRNVLAKALVLAPGPEIKPEDIPELEAQTDKEDSKLQKTSTQTATLQELEREAIAKALKRNNGNRAKTARELGIAASTLKDRIKRYGL